jgi:SAM-dependent methyltransferase
LLCCSGSVWALRWVCTHNSCTDCGVQRRYPILFEDPLQHSHLDEGFYASANGSALKAFGYEYAYRPDWGRLQRLFIGVFGVVDLPTRIRAHAVLWALRHISCDRVLDIGTGTGVYAFYVTRDPRCQAVALDIDANRIEIVRYIADRLERQRLATVCGDERMLATLPTDFSVVLAVEVLQYFTDLGQTLRELQQRLRPGGRLIAHVPVRKSLLPYEHSLFNDAVLRKLFVEAGFEPPEIRKTFGRVAQALCAIFTWCVPRPVLLAAVYPLLLLLTGLMPRFTQKGEYGRLVFARKPVVKMTAE